MSKYDAFTPNDEQTRSSEAFKDAVEDKFGKRFYDFNDEDWEELFRQYHEKAFPNFIVSVICVMSAGLADIRLRKEDTTIIYQDTSDTEHFKPKKRRMKPKPLD